MIEDGCSAFATRHEVREKLTELLLEPFDPEELAVHRQQKWEEMNVAAAERMGMGAEDDPHLAKPVNHPPRPGMSERVEEPVG